MNSRRRKTVVEHERNVGLNKLNPDSGLPKGYLSVSQVQMYLRCPKQYEFRYVNGLVIPPSVAMVEGITHHDVLKNVNLVYHKQKKFPPRKVVLEEFVDLMMDNGSKIDKNEWKSSEDDVDAVIDRGIGLLTSYMEKPIKPYGLPEEKIEVHVGGVPTVGFIDVQTKNSVWDYKVTNKKKTATEANNDIQLSVYAYVTHKEKVGFCCFDKKSGGVFEITSSRVVGDFYAVNAIFKGVRDSIAKGAFAMCNPTNIFPCSQKWCGYWRMCRGKLLRGR